MLLEVLDEPLLHGVREALAEDVGRGDITAQLIPADTTAQAVVISREPATLCGMAWFNAVFAELDSGIQINWKTQDGHPVAQDQVLCELKGPARPILTGERTALNFLQTLSATATLSRQFADEVKGLPVKILDTRKTIPGLRQAQKYAVRTGGCHNHRFGLYDGILIKENHITAAGSIQQAIDIARRTNPDMPVEVEVENLQQVFTALETGAERLLLDNFSLESLGKAVEQVAGRAKLEASGGINLENVRDFAKTGVDYISTGALTKNLHAIDLSMIFNSQAL